MKCIKCNSELTGNEKFCINCGTKVEAEEEKKCSQCGEVYTEGAAFCFNCGASLKKAVDKAAEEIKPAAKEVVEIKPVAETVKAEPQPVKIRKCFKCGTVAKGDEAFCMRCGAELPFVKRSPAKCIQCGAEVSSADNSCKNCGAVIKTGKTAVNNPDARICSKCGLKTVSTEMYCRGCGHPLKNDAVKKSEPGEKICSKCGMKPLGDEIYCRGCGTSLEKGSKYIYGDINSYYTDNDIGDEVAAIARSPVFILGIVFMALTVLFSFFAMDGSVFDESIRMFRNILPMDYDTAKVMYTIGANTPSVLIIIGLIITAANSGNKGTGGLKMLKVIEIIQCVGIFAVMGISFLIILFSGDLFETMPATMIIGGIIVLMVLYYKGLFRSLDFAIVAMDEDMCCEEPSMFLVVFNFIGAFSCALLALLVLATAPSTALPLLFQTVSIVLFNICLIRARNI